MQCSLSPCRATAKPAATIPKRHRAMPFSAMDWVSLMLPALQIGYSVPASHAHLCCQTQSQTLPGTCSCKPQKEQQAKLSGYRQPTVDDAWQHKHRQHNPYTYILTAKPSRQATRTWHLHVTRDTTHTCMHCCPGAVVHGNPLHLAALAAAAIYLNTLLCTPLLSL